MNCEQVEELLSAYLDDTLALGEESEAATQLNVSIAAHLETCIHCRTTLADFRRFDLLLAHLPRITPRPDLYERIFSSAEFLELADTYSISVPARTSHNPNSVYQHTRRDTPGRPQLLALPGGRRSTLASSSRVSRADAVTQLHPAARTHPRRGSLGIYIMQLGIVAVILLTLAVGGLISWRLWLQQNTITKSNRGITPPAGPSGPGTLPLSAGPHVVFLRSGALWSAPADGSSAVERLTPALVTVASNWAVSPPMPEHKAGDMLAYIDLQQGLVHTIRSDGLQDTPVPQPLFKTSVLTPATWNTPTGEAILHSLAWSKDGSMLAFAADPNGTGFSDMYIFTRATAQIRRVPLPMKGFISHASWSPDGKRIAFALAHAEMESILDYNTQTHGLLMLANLPDKLLTLDWSPNLVLATLTWSVGKTGHVRSLWLWHVGVSGMENPQILAQGDYTQASYSRNGDNGLGSWLLVSTRGGQLAQLWRIDPYSGALLTAITSGSQVHAAAWSPDGTQVDYLDAGSSGKGILHIFNTTTALNTPIASKVMSDPASAWSSDGRELVYSTGTSTIVVNVQAGRKSHTLNLHGAASTFAWSPNSTHQFVLALNGHQAGIYLVDTQRQTVLQVDPQGSNGPILWTEIP